MKLKLLLIFAFVFFVQEVLSSNSANENKKIRFSIDGSIASFYWKSPIIKNDSLFYYQSYIFDKKEFSRPSLRLEVDGDGILKRVEGSFRPDPEICQDKFFVGQADMKRLSSNIRSDNDSWLMLVDKSKELFSGKDFVYRLGAIAFFSGALNNHYDDDDSHLWRKFELNRLISGLVASQNGSKIHPELYGVCRHYAFATAKFVESAFDLKALVVTSRNHALTQITSPEANGFVLVDGGRVVSNLNGAVLGNKDDVDIFLLRSKMVPSLNDFVIDAQIDKVVYNNQYNNFAGFWNRLHNRNNIDRLGSFLTETQTPLFSYINEPGVRRVSVDYDNIGLQVYTVSGQNDYNRYLNQAFGFNLSIHRDILFKGKKNLLNRNFFNLGTYRAQINLDDNQETRPYWGSQVVMENYFSYSLVNNFAIGAVSSVALDKLIFSKNLKKQVPIRLDASYGISPFISLNLMKSKEYWLNLVSGTDILVSGSLPQASRLSSFPWIFCGLKQEKSNVSKMANLRIEFQPGSTSFNLLIRKDHVDYFFEIRSWYEKYANNFKKKSLLIDNWQVDVKTGIVLSQNSGREKIVFLSPVFKKNNVGGQSLNLKIGIIF